MNFKGHRKKVLYLHNYYAKDSGSHDEASASILRFKDGDDQAVLRFRSEMKSAMDKEYKDDLDLLKNTVICIMPSCEKGKYGDGLRRLAKYLKDTYEMIDGIELITRTETIKKLSKGGDRHLKVHMDSLEINKDYNVEGKDILLLDDITTSGNSIEAARRKLRFSNAGPVYVQTLGKTVHIGKDFLGENIKDTPFN